MADVFISYSRKDIAFARLIHQCFEESQLSTWIDWQDIPPAEDWLKEVYTAIEQAETFLFIISQTSVASDVCKLEISHAQENHKRIIPVVVHDLGAKAVNEFFPTLSALNWIFFLDGREFKLAQLPTEAGDGQENNAIPKEPQFRNAMQLLTQAIQVDQAWVRQHTRLQVRALEWERSGHDASYLLHGRDLEQAEAWLGGAAGKDPQPSPLQAQYVLASRKTASRRQRITFSAVSMGLIVAVVLGIFAWISRSEAVSQSNQRATAQVNAENAGGTAVAEAHTRATAEANAIAEAHQRATAEAIAVEQRDTALSRQLAVQSSSRLADEFDLSLLLGVEASRVKDTVESRSSLSAGLQAYPGLVRYLHASTLQQTFMDLAVSPDGKTIAAGGDANTIVLWDAASGQQLGEPLAGHDNWIEALLFTPDSQTLISADLYGRIIFWDYRNHQIARQIDMGGTRIELTLSPDGKTLVSGDGSGQIITWDVATGQQKATWVGCEDDWVIDALSIPAQGNSIAVSCNGGYNDGTVTFWSLMTGQPIGEPLEFSNMVGELTFSPDGKTLAIGRQDHGDSGEIWLWDMDRQDYIKYQYLSMPLIHPEDYGSLDGLEYSPDGRLLASGHGSSIILWDPKTGNQVGETFFSPTRTINRVIFSPDGKEMITPGAKGQLYVWKVDANRPLVTDLLEIKDWPDQVAFVPGGENTVLMDAGCGELVKASNNCAYGEISIWDLAQQPPKRTRLPGTFADVSLLAVSPDGKRAASGYASGEIRLWDLTTRAASLVLPGKHSYEVTGLSFSADGKFLASGGLDGSLFLWDLSQNPPGRTDLRPVSVPDGSGWSSEDPPISDLQFTPDSRTLVESGAGGEMDGQKILVWDLAEKTVRLKIRYERDNVSDDFEAMAISPDGKILAEATSMRIRLFSLATGEALPSPVKQLAEKINVLAFSPDGRLFATGGNDNMVTLWDVATWQVITQFGPFEYGVTSVSFSPDSRYLANTGDYWHLHVWDIGVETWQAAACQIANRNLTESEWENYMPGTDYHKTCPDFP